MKFSVNMLLPCILYCDAGPSYLIRTVCKYSVELLITDIIFSFICPRLIILRRRRSFTSRKQYVCLENFLYFLHQLDRAYISRA